MAGLSTLHSLLSTLHSLLSTLYSLLAALRQLLAVGVRANLLLLLLLLFVAVFLCPLRLGRRHLLVVLRLGLRRDLARPLSELRIQLATREHDHHRVVHPREQQ